MGIWFLLIWGVGKVYAAPVCMPSKPPALCMTKKSFPIVEIDPVFLDILIFGKNQSRYISCGVFKNNKIYIRKDLPPKSACAS